MAEDFEGMDGESATLTEPAAVSASGQPATVEQPAPAPKAGEGKDISQLLQPGESVEDALVRLGGRAGAHWRELKEVKAQLDRRNREYETFQRRMEPLWQDFEARCQAAQQQEQEEELQPGEPGYEAWKLQRIEQKLDQGKAESEEAAVVAQIVEFDQAIADHVGGALGLVAGGEPDAEFQGAYTTVINVMADDLRQAYPDATHDEIRAYLTEVQTLTFRQMAQRGVDPVQWVKQTAAKYRPYGGGGGIQPQSEQVQSGNPIKEFDQRAARTQKSKAVGKQPGGRAPGSLGVSLEQIGTMSEEEWLEARDKGVITPDMQKRKYAANMG